MATAAHGSRKRAVTVAGAAYLNTTTAWWSSANPATDRATAVRRGWNVQIAVHLGRQLYSARTARDLAGTRGRYTQLSRGGVGLWE